MGNPGASIETKAAKPFESESSSKSIKICNSQATLLYRLDLAQLTLHFPPCSCWLLAHRKCLCTMSKPLMNCLGGFKTVSIYTGREVSIDRTNTRLPPRFSNLHCQLANLATTLSLMFWRCTNRNRPSAMGMPSRYSLRFHIISRLGQQYSHQNTTLTSLFYKIFIGKLYMYVL
jgi:hypothetical protein